MGRERSLGVDSRMQNLLVTFAGCHVDRADEDPPCLECLQRHDFRLSQQPRRHKHSRRHLPFQASTSGLIRTSDW